MCLIPVRSTRCRFPFPIYSNHMQAFYVICSGPTRTRISPDGQRMTVVCPLRSAPMSYRGSCKNTIWT